MVVRIGFMQSHYKLIDTYDIIYFLSDKCHQPSMYMYFKILFCIHPNVLFFI